MRNPAEVDPTGVFQSCDFGSSFCAFSCVSWLSFRNSGSYIQIRLKPMGMRWPARRRGMPPAGSDERAYGKEAQVHRVGARVRAQRARAGGRPRLLPGFSLEPVSCWVGCHCGENGGLPVGKAAEGCWGGLADRSVFHRHDAVETPAAFDRESRCNSRNRSARRFAVPGFPVKVSGSAARCRGRHRGIRSC